MMNTLAALLAMLQILLSALSAPALTSRMRSGEWLRFHVIAQDDTAPMQRLKLQVRDAVQDAYAASASAGTAMLTQAMSLLPALTQAARDAADQAGFPGAVEVQLGMFPFDERQLFGQTIPAGEYPALVIRLGDAQGQNWWGLLDPELALRLACIAGEDEAAQPILWDWSWQALLAALLGLPLTAEGA